MSQLLSAYAAGTVNPAFNLMPRASYIATINASSSATQQVSYFYDSEFRRLLSGATNAINTPQGMGNYDTYSSSTQMMPWAGYTHTNASTNTGFAPNYTTASGELGNDHYYAMERGQHESWLNRTGITGNTMTRMSQAVVNSDHSDKGRVLQLDNGYLTNSPFGRPLSRLYTYSTGVYVSASRTEKQIIAQGTATQAMVNAMRGSASYNNVRKELVVMVYNSTTAGQYDIYLWKNFDLDNSTVDVTSLPNTPTKVWSIQTNALATASGSNFTIETQQNITPVLVDDGSIFYVAMYPSAANRLFKITRSGDDSTVSVALSASGTLTTSYGIEQGTGYGSKHISSRDGRLVGVWCPYYYYGAGMAAHWIDKRTGTYYSTLVQDSTYGVNVTKYRDEALIYATMTPVYQASGNGQFSMNTIGVRNGAVTAAGLNILTEYPASQNSSYPYAFSISHVAEYNTQSYLAL